MLKKAFFGDVPEPPCPDYAPVGAILLLLGAVALRAESRLGRCVAGSGPPRDGDVSKIPRKAVGIGVRNAAAI